MYVSMLAPEGAVWSKHAEYLNNIIIVCHVQNLHLAITLP